MRTEKNPRKEWFICDFDEIDIHAKIGFDWFLLNILNIFVLLRRCSLCAIYDGRDNLQSIFNFIYPAFLFWGHALHAQLPRCSSSYAD